MLSAREFHLFSWRKRRPHNINVVSVVAQNRGIVTLESYLP